MFTRLLSEPQVVMAHYVNLNLAPDATIVQYVKEIVIYLWSSGFEKVINIVETFCHIDLFSTLIAIVMPKFKK